MVIGGSSPPPRPSRFGADHVERSSCLTVPRPRPLSTRLPFCPTAVLTARATFDVQHRTAFLARRRQFVRHPEVRLQAPEHRRPSTRRIGSRLPTRLVVGAGAGQMSDPAIDAGRAVLGASPSHFDLRLGPVITGGRELLIRQRRSWPRTATDIHIACTRHRASLRLGERRCHDVLGWLR